MTRLASMLPSSARLVRLPRRQSSWRFVGLLGHYQVPSKKACGIISGNCSGELLCLFFPLSRLELYPGRFLISAERGCYIAASACEGHAVGGFRRDVQSQVILEERLGPLLELLLGKSGLHVQFEHRSTPAFPSLGEGCFQCPSAHARVPAIARHDPA